MPRKKTITETVMEAPVVMLGVGEAAERLQLSENTVRRWVDDNTIVAQRVNGRRQIPESEVRRVARARGILREGKVLCASCEQGFAEEELCADDQMCQPCHPKVRGFPPPRPVS